MGISDNDSTKEENNKTNRMFKLKAFFYPSLKTHKLTNIDLVPGGRPSVTLVTALHEGISKRSDVSLASEYFRKKTIVKIH